MVTDNELPGWSRWKERLSSMPTGPAEPTVPALERKRLHEEQQEVRFADHLSACGVPLRNIELLTSGTALEDTAAVLGVRQWLRSGKGFLLLAGGFGTGKTTAACAALKMARSAAWFIGDDDLPVQSWNYDHRMGLFARAAELSSTSPYAQEGRGVWSRVRRVPWLVVDDLGMERMDNAGIWAEQFDLLVDCRYGGDGRGQRELRTVFSTNLDEEGFTARYHGRVMDRIKDAGLVVLCGGKSLRGRVA